MGFRIGLLVNMCDGNFKWPHQCVIGPVCAGGLAPGVGRAGA